MSGIDAAAKVTDSHLRGWGSIPGKCCSFIVVLAYHCILCVFDQHVKYRMHTYTHRYMYMARYMVRQPVRKLV